MIRIGWGSAIAVWLLTAGPATADELRERQLESDVRRLERDLTALSRRIEQLERAGATRSIGTKPAALPQAEAASPAWLVGTNWDRIKPGMSITEVVALLGRPTSTRADDAGRIQKLLYAMELGPNAVLAGNVTLGASGVTDVSRPQVR